MVCGRVCAVGSSGIVKYANDGQLQVGIGERAPGGRLGRPDGMSLARERRAAGGIEDLRKALMALDEELRRATRDLDHLVEPAARLGEGTVAIRALEDEEGGRGAALQLQYEYDGWRDRLGLNPTDRQYRVFARVAGVIALASGEMVP